MAANQNVTQLTQQSGTASPTSLFYAVINGTTDTGLPLSVFVNSLGLTGTPTTPTASTGTNTTQIASTAFVQAQLTSTLASYAPLASPTFTGTVVIPTVTISAGTINGTSVGATTPSTGSFTTIASSGLATLSSVSTAAATITGGTINGTSLGLSTPSAVSATTINATGVITPSQTAGIVGTTTNNNTNAGSVGEFISSNVPVGSAVPLTTFTVANVTSISLTAGDWDVWGDVVFVGTGSTVVTNIQGSISTTTAAFPTTPGNGAYFQLAAAFTNGATLGLPVGTTRLSLASTTTVFLVCAAGFSASTYTAYGFIGARRRR